MLRTPFPWFIAANDVRGFLFISVSDVIAWLVVGDGCVDWFILNDWAIDLVGLIYWVRDSVIRLNRLND